jgi:hypothetical protein
MNSNLYKNRLIPLYVMMLIIMIMSVSCDSERSVDQSKTGSIPNIIYDGDIGGVPCDYSTIAILLNYHKIKMINLLGMVSAQPNDYLVSVFDIFNQIHKTSVPIGAYKKYALDDPDADYFENTLRSVYNNGSKTNNYSGYRNKHMFEKFSNDSTKVVSQVLPSVEFYRKALSESEDNSVIIYAVGQLYNFSSFFASKTDEYSALGGLELVQKKVKQFVFMGGYFPETGVESKFSHEAEYNWWALGQKGITKTTIETIRTINMPILYAGFGQGVKVPAGTNLQTGDSDIPVGFDHPLVDAYALNHYKTIEKAVNKEGKIVYSKAAFDESSVFYLAEANFGTQEYNYFFSKIEGLATIRITGVNGWMDKNGTNEFRFGINGDEFEFRELISDRIKVKFSVKND